MIADWEKPLCLALAVALAATLGIGTAVAAGKGNSGASGGGGKSGGHHSGKNHSRHHNQKKAAVGAGVFAAGPWWPWWGYPGYFPAVAVAPVPVTYIERGEQEGQPAGEWLYCAKTQGYFPYVGECADGWERVPAAPLK